MLSGRERNGNEDVIVWKTGEYSQRNIIIMLWNIIQSGCGSNSNEEMIGRKAEENYEQNIND